MKLYPDDYISTITFSTTMPDCKHCNGWFERIRLNWWIFEMEEIYFVCTDCRNCIPKKDLNK